MNIKNRLKKLETISDDSAFCACFPQRFETYIQDLGEKAPLDSQPYLTSEPVPDVCLTCRRQTEKNTVVVQIVDGTTKNRFPSE